MLAAELDKQGLFFPAGHCEGICVGGYLLQGGYGWNSRVVGPACESVIGIDVVTADGEQLYCDSDTNADLYWAAKGSGPGYFAVVTSFHLRLHPKPPICGSCLYISRRGGRRGVHLGAVDQSSDRRPGQLQIIVSKNLPALGLDHPSIVVSSPAFAETEEEARQKTGNIGHLPRRRPSDHQSPIRDNRSGRMVWRDHEQLSGGSPLRGRQYVDIGVGK